MGPGNGDLLGKHAIRVLIHVDTPTVSEKKKREQQLPFRIRLFYPFGFAPNCAIVGSIEMWQFPWFYFLLFLSIIVHWC